MCCWGLIARQDIPQPGAKASPFGAVWKAALFKISRQMQITHSADTMEQTYMCHCHFCFHFLILLPETSRGTHESFVICKAKTTEQLCEKFPRRSLVFAEVFYRMQKLTDFWKLWLFSHFHLLSVVSALSTKFFPCMKENITFKSGVYFGFSLSLFP